MTDFLSSITNAYQSNPALLNEVETTTSTQGSDFLSTGSWLAMNSDAISAGGSQAAFYNQAIGQEIMDGTKLLGTLGDIAKADPTSSSWASALSSKIGNELNALYTMSGAAAKGDTAALSAAAGTFAGELGTTATGLNDLGGYASVASMAAAAKQEHEQSIMSMTALMEQTMQEFTKEAQGSTSQGGSNQQGSGGQNDAA